MVVAQTLAGFLARALRDCLSPPPPLRAVPQCVERGHRLVPLVFGRRPCLSRSTASRVRIRPVRPRDGLWLASAGLISHHWAVPRLAFIRPLSPSTAVRPPKGDGWLHEYSRGWLPVAGWLVMGTLR